MSAGIKLKDILIIDAARTYTLHTLPARTMYVGTLAVDTTRDALLRLVAEDDCGQAWRVKSLICLARQGELRAGDVVDVELVEAG